MVREREREKWIGGGEIRAKGKKEEGEGRKIGSVRDDSRIEKSQEACWRGGGGWVKLVRQEVWWRRVKLNCPRVN